MFVLYTSEFNHHDDFIEYFILQRQLIANYDRDQRLMIQRFNCERQTLAAPSTIKYMSTANVNETNAINNRLMIIAKNLDVKFLIFLTYKLLFSLREIIRKYKRRFLL